MKYTIRICLCILAINLLFISCKKKENSEIPQPIKEIMSASDDCTCNPFIDQYLWKGQVIYLSSCGGPACDCTTLFYNKNGERIEMIINNDKFREESTFIRNIWTCN